MKTKTKNKNQPLKSFEIVNSAMRTARDIVRVQARDMKHAADLDQPRRKRLGIVKYLIREVK